MVDWELQTCCNQEQWIAIGLVCGYSLIIFFLWNRKILLPLKLLVVFLHEMGHATAVWMTCGEVLGIKVEENQGGVTESRGGKMWVILPAGYLGSSFWGCFFIIMGSADHITAQIAAIMLAVALLGVLFCKAKNCLLRGLSIGFLVLITGLFALEIVYGFFALEYLLVLIGVMSGLYSIFDVYDDLIRRKELESDASKFAEQYGGSSRCWGVVWGIVSIAFLGAGVYFSLLILGETA